MKVLPKALIFDFDGVILESVDIKSQAFLDLFCDYPEHHDAILKHHLENLGISRFHKFHWIHSQILGKPLNEIEALSLGKRFSELVLEKILKCPFVPGANEVLKALHARSFLFVASGTPQEELERIIALRNLAELFTEVWGTPLQKPDIISSILSRYRVTPEQVLFIGDGLSDYNAAKAVGVPFLARESGEMNNWSEIGVDSVRDLWDLGNLLDIEGTRAPS